MKICLMLGLYWDRGGPSLNIERLSNALVRDGHEVIIISTDTYKNLRSLKSRMEMKGKVKVYRFSPINVKSGYNYASSSNLLSPFFFFLNIFHTQIYAETKKILEKEKPDVVDMHGFFSPLATSMAIQSLDVPFVWTRSSLDTRP